MICARAVLTGAAVVTVLAGCAALGLDGGRYSREQAGRIETVRMGLVESVREESVSPKRSIALTVKLDDGHTVAIVQEADGTFRPGERVRVVSDGAAARVTR